MKRLLHPFVLVVSAILLVGYAYIAMRLTSTTPMRMLLAVPFVMVWILPAVYWFGNRDRQGRGHDWVQALSFLCMAWLSFLFVLTVGRDVLLLATAALPPLVAVHTLLDQAAGWVPVAALAAVGVGVLPTLAGPYVRRVDIPVPGLAPELDGLRIVQISDLHVGPTMRLAYVQRVVDMTQALAPDVIALTGDIVDGSVPRLAPHVAPLEALASADRASRSNADGRYRVVTQWKIFTIHGRHVRRQTDCCRYTAQNAYRPNALLRPSAVRLLELQGPRYRRQ